MSEASWEFTRDDGITIRRAVSIADYRACQAAQRVAWGINEDGYLVPVATMAGANLHGGLVLGAFLRSGEAVAMSFAFLGRIEGRLCLYSQLTGVIPGFQSRGLGYEIKRVQREFARQQDIPIIAWAFDPLQAGNAYFNLVRLGATSRHYIENMYGARTDALNRGVPTDRLIAEWETTPAATAGSAALPETCEGLPALIETQLVAAGTSGGSERKPRFLGAGALGPPRLLLEIPTDMVRLREEVPALAEEWHRAAKVAFCAAFDAEYRAVSFLRGDQDSKGRGFYVLERL
jgi:predicted GNAT superfamily acetyltransferase